MNETNNYNADKIEFREIVLGHIKRILDISSSDLRDKTIIKNHGNFSETIENEDTRRSYIQSIENLSYVLIPYFDDEMQKIYDECEPIINSFKYVLVKNFKEDYDKIIYDKLIDDNKKKNLVEVFCIEMKLKYAKKLFVALNMLLKRNDYLKSAVYGEDRDELISDEENEGDGE
jgi:hypothetical protein